MRKLILGYLLIVLSFSINTVSAQNLTVEQKAKIFWQGFVNSYKKNNVVNFKTFDPNGIKVDWPIPIMNSVNAPEPSLVEYIDFKNNDIAKQDITLLFNFGSSSVALNKVYKLNDISTDIIPEETKSNYRTIFIDKYGSNLDDLYVVTNYNTKTNYFDYSVAFLVYDGINFKIAGIYVQVEVGD